MFSSSCSLWLRSLYRTNPYYTTLNSTAIVVFNIFDTFTSFRGIAVGEDDCAVGLYTRQEVSCIGSNSTAQTSFYLDGTGLYTLCILLVLLVLFHVFL